MYAMLKKLRITLLQLEMAKYLYIVSENFILTHDKPWSLQILCKITFRQYV